MTDSVAFAIVHHLMLSLVLSTVFAFIPCQPAAADSVRPDPEKLRAAVHFPIHTARSDMALTIGLGFSPTRGFHIRVERPDHDAEIARLRMQIQRGPVRARDLRALGDLYGEVGEIGRARDAYGKAVTLYRRRARRGRDGRLALDLGMALHRNREYREAERVLRGAVRREPGAWRGWTALAQVLEARIRSRESGEGANAALLDETRRCYDRAVAVAPGQSGPYAFRGNFRLWSEPALRQVVNGAGSGGSTRAPGPPRSGCVGDLRQAARLSPGDPYAIAGSAWLQFFYFAARRGATGGDTAEAWKSLSPREQQPTRRAIVLLERMAKTRERNGDRPGAARALAALGFIRYETFEPTHVAQAQADLGRALVLDPTRQDAAEMLMHVLAVENNHAALAEFVQSLIRRRDTVRYRLIAAYDSWNAERLTAAEAHLRAALRLAPAHSAAAISLAAALLKSGGDERVLAEAEQRLAALDVPPASPAAERAEYALLRAVYLARTGSLEEAAALARDALKLDPSVRGGSELVTLLGAGHGL